MVLRLVSNVWKLCIEVPFFNLRLRTLASALADRLAGATGSWVFLACWILLVQQQLSPRFLHVPPHVVGRPAPEDVHSYTLFQMVVDRPHHETGLCPRCGIWPASDTPGLSEPPRSDDYLGDGPSPFHLAQDPDDLLVRVRLPFTTRLLCCSRAPDPLIQVGPAPREHALLQNHT